jgi:hypothetical protein
MTALDELATIAHSILHQIDHPHPDRTCYDFHQLHHEAVRLSDQYWRSHEHLPLGVTASEYQTALGHADRILNVYGLLAKVGEIPGADDSHLQIGRDLVSIIISGAAIAFARKIDLAPDKIDLR